MLIDPISAYLGVGKVDSFRTTDVRAVLGPLVELAAELQVAIVGVMHFNKKIDITNALLRISDSLAFAATARHVYGVIDDAENKRKLWCAPRTTSHQEQAIKTLAFRFGVARSAPTGNREGDHGRRTFSGTQHVDVTAMEAMQAAADNKSPAARDEAKKFLVDMLADGPVAKTEIEDAAEANGICRANAIPRESRTQSPRQRDKGKDGLWRWQLPDDFAVKN